MTTKLLISRANKLWVILVLLFPVRSFCTVYYVSSTGNDFNSGTSVINAWATIAKVNNTIFLPGDVLYFEGGQTFSGSIYLDSHDANDPANTFRISSYGTDRATINAGTSYGLYAYNTQGFSISNLIFDGNSMSTNTDVGINLYADLPGDIKFSNISLLNIEVKNFGSQGVRIGSLSHLTGYQNLILDRLSVHDVKTNGIQVFSYTSQTLVGWPHNNVSISNCEVYNVPGFADPSSHQGSGILVSGVDNGLVQNCVAHDNGQNNSHCGGPGGIWCFDSNHFTIQYCESYGNHAGTGCDGMGFDFDGGMTNSIMQYNYSHNNDGAGFLLGQYQNARPWANNTVRYNISENDGKVNEGSIDLFKGPGTTMSGANIYHNTVYVSPQSGNVNDCAVNFKNWNTGINNVGFYNNIFLSAGGVPLINIPTGYSAFFAGNLYWPSGSNFSINYQGVNYSSLAAWRAATGNEVIGGNNTGLSSDPLLTNAGNGGIIGFGNSLSSLSAYKVGNISSPVCNAALDINALYSINVGNTDFWGAVLPGGNANDIGGNQLTVSLPVKLLDFHGSCSDAAQEISWTTTEEINMQSFELMYSGDGYAFHRLAEISAKGSNSNYSYINDFALPGTSYYQLKMTDLDGSVSTSAILKMKCEPLTNKIIVWPNPFTSNVNISIESNARRSATITLYDALGKIFSRRQLLLQEGINQLSLNGMDNYPTGSYYLQVLNQDHTEHFKLIKTGGKIKAY